MSANISLWRWTDLSGGGPGNATNITGITTRVNASDDPLPGTNNGIQVPTSGLHYSFWCSVRMKCTVAPNNAVNNVRLYTTGVNPFKPDIDLLVTHADYTQIDSGYTEATGTLGVSGAGLTHVTYPATDNVLGVNGGGDPVDIFTYLVDTPLLIPGSIGPSVGYFANIIVYQFQVGPAAENGASNDATVYIEYDEF